MSKVFSKLKRTTIQELISSTNERTITSVGIENGGSDWEIDDVVQIAGGTVMKVTAIANTFTEDDPPVEIANTVSELTVVSSAVYSNLVALSNVSVYSVANNIANTQYSGQQSQNGKDLTINVVLDTNAPKKNRFYVLASGTTQYTTVQEEKESEYDSFLNLWDETLFGKAADIIPVAKRYKWNVGESYAAYDDRDSSLKDKKFYVVNGSNIFKCIDNGANSTVTAPPSNNEPILVQSNIGSPFMTGDGYRWLYIGSIDPEIDNNFGTTSHFPVVESTIVKGTSIEGALFSIKVETGGVQYKTVSGKTTTPLGLSVTNAVALKEIIDNPSHYVNCGIMISDGAGGLYVRKIQRLDIINPGSENAYTRVTLAEGESFPAEDSNGNPFLKIGLSYIISPYVEIKSKTGFGASAFSEVGPGGSISKINMIDYGQEYKDVEVNILAAPSIGEGAKARGIISPGAGHGSNIFDELFVDSFCVSSKFNESNFPTTPKYSTIALLKNPTTPDGSPFYGFSFNQTIDIPLNQPSDGSTISPFTEGEFVYGNAIDLDINRFPSGKVAFANSTLLQLTGVDGSFYPGSVISNEKGTVVAESENQWNAYFGEVVESVGSKDYTVKLYSGEALYAKNIQLVERNELQPEIVKIIVKL